MKPDEVNMVERPSKLTKLGQPPIVFSEEDEEGISYPHDDPLVISMVVANYRIKRILVDTGASMDIIYYSSFLQLEIDEKRLRTKEASGAGLVLQSPEGKKFKYVLRFRFQATNNQAEALIIGLQLAKAVRAGSLAIISDSQLVVG
ncbi:hypothetical protein Vadar_000444 [Vaccinium darrowii]|uniref:Uncharacterized protein n=1 Tax=Vaccinium darrowii TaxID=229202 RepID=A0ACB7XMA2_9ERIC|nr:hypothetical protein Vadar_000444 [Vaccinium darrowii]